MNSNEVPINLPSLPCSNYPLHPLESPEDRIPYRFFHKFGLVRQWINRNPGTAYYAGLVDPLDGPIPYPIEHARCIGKGNPPPYWDEDEVESTNSGEFPHEIDPFDQEDRDDPIPLHLFSTFYKVYEWIGRNPLLAYIIGLCDEDDESEVTESSPLPSEMVNLLPSYTDATASTASSSTENSDILPSYTSSPEDPPTLPPPF